MEWIVWIIRGFFILMVGGLLTLMFSDLRATLRERRGAMTFKPVFRRFRR